mgnify:CR=1 FL=1
MYSFLLHAGMTLGGLISHESALQPFLPRQEHPQRGCGTLVPLLRQPAKGLAQHPRVRLFRRRVLQAGLRMAEYLDRAVDPGPLPEENAR